MMNEKDREFVFRITLEERARHLLDYIHVAQRVKVSLMRHFNAEDSTFRNQIQTRVGIIEDQIYEFKLLLSLCQQQLLPLSPPIAPVSSAADPEQPALTQPDTDQSLDELLPLQDPSLSEQKSELATPSTKQPTVPPSSTNASTSSSPNTNMQYVLASVYKELLSLDHPKTHHLKSAPLIKCVLLLEKDAKVVYRLDDAVQMISSCVFHDIYVPIHENVIPDNAKTS